MKGAAWLIAAAVVAFVVWKLRQTARRVLGADGRTFVMISPPGTPNAAGIASGSRWRTVPDDGHEYSPNLAWEMGQDREAPMFSRYV